MSEYQRQLEAIIAKKNGDEDISPRDIWNALSALGHDNEADHKTIKTSIASHCTDPNAHESMKVSDAKRVGAFIRDKLAAPVVVAVTVAVIMLAFGH